MLYFYSILLHVKISQNACFVMCFNSLLYFNFTITLTSNIAFHISLNSIFSFIFFLLPELTPCGAARMSENQDINKKIVTCSLCDITFSRRNSLYRHLRRFHPDANITFKCKPVIICFICDKTFFNMTKYLNHICSEHPQVQLLFKKKCFYTDEDFFKWKSDMETQTQSHFAAYQKNYKLANGQISSSYYCDRSSQYSPCGRRNKHKFEGTKNIATTCPANIRVLKTVVDDLMEIEMTFQSMHMGTELDADICRHSGASKKRLKNKCKNKKTTKLFKMHHKLIETPSKEQMHSKQLIKEIHRINGHEKIESSTNEVATIFCHNPDLVSQKMCMCEKYLESATCEHIQATYSLDMVATQPKEVASSDSNSLIIDSFSAEDNESQGCFVSKKDSNGNCLEVEKSSLLAEFKEIIDNCEKMEQIKILKDIVKDAKVRLSSASGLENLYTTLSQQNNTVQRSTVQQPLVIRIVSAYSIAPESTYFS